MIKRIRGKNKQAYIYKSIFRKEACEIKKVMLGFLDNMSIQMCTFTLAVVFKSDDCI